MIRKGEWSMLVIPAIAPRDETYQIGSRENDLYRRREGEVLLPEREPRNVLEATRRELGTMNFSAQYMQDPVPPGGNVIDRSWLSFYDEEPGSFDYLLASWDPASTIGEHSSYSVGTLWGQVGPDYYLLELTRRKLETPELRKLILAWDREHEPHETVVEGPGLGQSLVQEIRRTSDMRIGLYNPRADKEERLLTQSVRFEAGQVHLPRHAPWLRAYIDELLAAPFGAYWDQVDSTTQALDVLMARRARSRPLRRREITRREVAGREPEAPESDGQPARGRMRQFDGPPGLG
ncbi:phage terminase large subunit [Enterovirga sp. CN4-39]|uniref:phage terminase large subunit n=1 Tax=Enterovirga sp. CN4-39 TaxID=3400910 RepID=UPI003C08AE8D